MNTNNDEIKSIESVLEQPNMAVSEIIVMIPTITITNNILQHL